MRDKLELPRVSSQSTNHLYLPDENCFGKDGTIIEKFCDFPDVVVDEDDVLHPLDSQKIEYMYKVQQCEFFTQVQRYQMEQLAEMDLIDFEKNQAMVVCNMSLEDIIPYLLGATD